MQQSLRAFFARCRGKVRDLLNETSDMRLEELESGAHEGLGEEAEEMEGVEWDDDEPGMEAELSGVAAALLDEVGDLVGGP
jgi:hypothetical protein